MSSLTIPSLDLGRLDAGESERAEVLAELRDASRRVGFFYLTNHGIEQDLLDGLMTCAARFFALPEPDKRALDMVNSRHFRGYTRLAGERTRGSQDWREQIDIGAEQPPLAQLAGAPAWTRLQGPNQWPSALPELRPAVTGWQAAATRVLSRLLRAFASSLGQSEDALEHLYRDSPHILIKLICYPGREHTGSDQGVGAHKDSGLLSLLLQDEQGGLQVETTLLREVGQNYLKGRLRSHPDVARRHFADLIHPGAPVEAFSGY